VTGANAISRAITRVQALRRDAQQNHDECDVEGVWLDENGCLDGWANEADHDASVSRLDTLDEVITLLLGLLAEERAADQA